MESRDRTRFVAALALAVLGAVLLVVHLALDAGEGREAPNWVVLAAVVAGALGAVVGFSGSRRR